MIKRLIKLLLSMFFYFLRKGIFNLSSLLKKPLPNPIVVLTYHSVKNNQRYKFEKQMEELIKIGRPISASLDRSISNKEHNIAVTFDDGFQSVLYNALPVLIKLNIPATIFVPTAYLGNKSGWICNPKHENANEIILTAEQLKIFPNDLITIGSHCVTHPYLAIIDKYRALGELVDSKHTLDNILQRDISLLSLPYGSYDKEIIELSKRAGYERIFLNIPTFSSSQIGGYLVGRIHISLDDWLIEYRLKLLGAYQWLPVAIFIKRKVINLIQTILHRRKKR